jgi:hypothetical protein
MAMQIVDRIEKRRFVGREFLLWLWFESELFEATLSTQKHGSFGMWVEQQLVLSAGKEATRIKGSFPGGGRDAKEALLAGKLPEVATFRLTWKDSDIAFTLKAEKLAVSGLKLPTVLGGETDDAPVSLAPKGPPRGKTRRTTVAEDAEREADGRAESFYERMALTRDVEGLIEALYGDFLALRLGDRWSEAVHPAQLAWAAGKRVDAERYREATRGGKKASKRRTSSAASGARDDQV